MDETGGDCDQEIVTTGDVIYSRENDSGALPESYGLVSTTMAEYMYAGILGTELHYFSGYVSIRVFR